MKRSKHLVFLLVSIAAAFCASASARTVGSGKVVTEARALTGVQSIDLAGSGDLTIIQGDAEDFSVDGEDNILPLLETTVDKGALRIGLKPDAAPTVKLKMKLTVKTLDTVKLSGSGKIHTEKLTAAGPLEVDLIGSGMIDLKGIECSKWNLSIIGSGDVKAAGHAKEQKVTVVGSGDYEGFGLETGVAEVTVSGSGDCEINATEKLTATISGSGDIDYTGPATVTRKVTGSGAVTQVENPKKG